LRKSYIFAAQTLQGENPLAAFMARVGEAGAEARLLRAYKAKGCRAASWCAPIVSWGRAAQSLLPLSVS